MADYGAFPEAKFVSPHNEWHGIQLSLFAIESEDEELQPSPLPQTAILRNQQ